MDSSKDKGWKNPGDIMKSHRIQRSTRRLLQSQSLILSRRESFPLSKENLPSECYGDAGILKRRNPFLSGELAKKHRSKPMHSQSISPTAIEDKKLLSTDFFNEDNEREEIEDLQDVVESMGRSLKSMQNKLSVKKLKENANSVNFVCKRPLSDTMVLNDTALSDRSKVVYSKPILDWSLKNKMRVVISHAKLMCSDTVPGIHAKNVNAFVHGTYETDQRHNLDILHQIRRFSFHYSYPKMPWMSTFPRLKSYFKSRSSFLDTGNSDVLNSLQKDWSKTFTSVYQQLRGGLCPYFYVCAHQFTVLFRCQRSEFKCFLTVLLSPSTRGLRELLEKEGISFQMPNWKKEKQTTEESNKKSVDDHDKLFSKEVMAQSNLCETNETDTDTQKGYESSDEDLFDDNVDDDIGDGKIESDSIDDGNNKDKPLDSSPEEDENNDNLAYDWLENMGLNKKDFPSLRPHNVKLQRENYQDIDNRTQSLVYMEGLEVHAFFNFLLNYPGCIANSGTQYGIPPTIIAPHSFEGGTLMSNTVKQSVIRDDNTVSGSIPSRPNDAGDTLISQSSHVIEITGPILPHHTLNISSILKESETTSTLSYNVHPPSTAFNTVEKSNEQRLDILTTGLCKLLVPFSSKNLGLLKEVENELTSDFNLSVREASVSGIGFHYNL